MANPIVYELNLRCRLAEWGRRSGRVLTLSEIPPAELRRWQDLGVTHVWLMGLWPTGPLSRAAALQPAAWTEYRRALPDCREADVPGSPYAIADYRVPESIGGEAGLAALRDTLNQHGIRLILDFVPNHLGLDHPWLKSHPDRFVQATENQPGTVPIETSAGLRHVAHGRDPHFSPWTDTVQLDYRQAETRGAMGRLLERLAAMCDGVRCDMAMLVLRDVFEKTWREFPRAAGAEASGEFWEEAIAAVKSRRPDFLFIAEAYWGLEPRLQSLGFDFTYDKVFYDGLVRRDAAGVQRHVMGQPAAVLSCGLRFLENHDEPRIAALLSPAEQRAAAVALLALPGMRLLHDGQLSGARTRVPVQLSRGPVEIRRPEVELMYERLLSVVRDPVVAGGQGRVLVPAEAWPGNPSRENFVVVVWQSEPRQFGLAAVNLAGYRSQCRVSLPVPGLDRGNWQLRDLLGSEEHRRDGAALASEGLFLDLPAHAAQWFHGQPVGRP
ncbi:MAG: alpha-amylase family glycosyl hydrolase [Verrucomicrobiota bacterium]